MAILGAINPVLTAGLDGDNAWALWLREEFGGTVTPVAWARRAFALADGPAKEVEFKPSDWLLTVELFSEAERPGLAEFLRQPPCRLAAMFHDAIPLRWPHITWPQSVQRHPEYMKLLASFDRVFAISEASRRDLTGFWRWQGVTPRARVDLIDLGADFDGSIRVQRDAIIPKERPVLLCVGIVEPRKNQAFLLDVAEALWREGVNLSLMYKGQHVELVYADPLHADAGDVGQPAAVHRVGALEERHEHQRLDLAELVGPVALHHVLDAHVLVRGRVEVAGDLQVVPQHDPGVGF